MNAYIDIETSYQKEITILGIYSEVTGFHQLIWDKIIPENIMHVLHGTETIYTYNGKRFDIPVIADKTGLNLADHFKMHDLMFDCWKKKLYGGLKNVEKTLGIDRGLKGVNGLDAMRLWDEYYLWQEQESLNRLLEYNKEDVMNLEVLRKKLEEINNLQYSLCAGGRKWNY
jgi:uncharacterized protein YprB with RNaseH-like and TPR domain